MKTKLSRTLELKFEDETDMAALDEILAAVNEHHLTPDARVMWRDLRNLVSP